MRHFTPQPSFPEASLRTFISKVTVLPVTPSLRHRIRYWLVLGLLACLTVLLAPAPGALAVTVPVIEKAGPAPAYIPAKLSFPALTGRVVDDAHVLTPGAVTQLKVMLKNEESRTGNQVVVATLPSLQGDAIDDYGYQLGRFWGIGQKGKNNGALIIVVPSEHKIRIESGYGDEAMLTDAASSNIINSIMLPAFRDGDIDRALLDGTRAVLDTIDPPSDRAAPPRPQPPSGGDQLTPLQMAGVVLGLIFLLWLSIEHPQLAWFIFRLALMFASSSSGGRDSFRGGGGSFGGGGASGSW